MSKAYRELKHTEMHFFFIQFLKMKIYSLKPIDKQLSFFHYNIDMLKWLIKEISSE